jgi:hypothetical protein
MEEDHAKAEQASVLRLLVLDDASFAEQLRKDIKIVWQEHGILKQPLVTFMAQAARIVR